MDKELPWLADNAQLELKYKKGKTPLSHRNWPGEPVPVITESIIQTLGDELLQKAEKKKTIVRAVIEGLCSPIKLMACVMADCHSSEKFS